LSQENLRSEAKMIPASNIKIAEGDPMSAAWNLPLVLMLALGLAGCGATRSTQRAEPYGNGEWLQSGANRIANLALRDNLESVRRVQLSLYKRNPREWRKWAASRDEAISRVWSDVMQGVPMAQIGGAVGIGAIRAAFDPAFAGDRVAALVVGWATMLKQANGDTWSQTMIDGVDAENAFRAARNVEISAWLLYARRDAKAQPMLLSTEVSDQGRNLVVDRELSKMVARLDLMAAQADEKYRRAALDFSQNFLMGSVAPFLQLVPH